MEKRGQISPIIIGAILVVLGIIAVLTVRHFIIKTGFDIQYEKHIKVPLQVRPVVEYMDDCIFQIAQEGANSLGQQGGYIDLPYEPVSAYTPLTKSLEIFPNSGIKTALWFREKPNGIKITEVPELSDMEKDLESYINGNINRCINNLTAFAEAGYTIEFLETPKANVDILDNSIEVVVDYPMNIILKDLKYPLKQHLAQVPVSLGKLYKISKKIIQAENEQLFLEKQTIDQLVAYEEIPFSGVDLSCTPKIWSKSKTFENIKNILSLNTQLIKLKGTNYELPSKEHKYFEFDTNIDNPEIQANFLYSPSWPTMINVDPSSGDIMKGSQISDKVNDISLSVLSSFFCLSDHHFVYDLKYPVLVTLIDPSGYIFQFGTLVVIDNNQPRQSEYEQLDFEEPAFDSCDYPSNQITFSTYSPDEAGILKPLEGAEIFFKCFPDGCELGETKLIAGEALLTANSPSCANAVIEARKENYYPGKILVNTNEPIEDINPIILEPFYKKEIEIKIIDKDSGEIRDMYESETVVFQFNHKQTDHSTSLSYSIDSPIEQPIKLLMGDYEIVSYVLGSSTWPITFPSQKITHCVDVKASGILGLFKEEEKCFETELPSVELDAAIKGGVKFDYFFTRKELSSETPLRLYTVAQSIPSSVQGLTHVYESIEENKDIPNFRYPET